MMRARPKANAVVTPYPPRVAEHNEAPTLMVHREMGDLLLTPSKLEKLSELVQLTQN